LIFYFSLKMLFDFLFDSLPSLSSSSSYHFNALGWTIFAVFCLLTVIAAIECIALGIKYKMAYPSLILFAVGWILRIGSLLNNGTNEIVSNFAGLAFFSACCLVVADLLKNYHEQHDTPGSVYISLRNVFIGYNIFFYVLVASITVAMFVVPKTMDSEMGDSVVDAVDSVLSILFGASFAFISITCIVILLTLRKSLNSIKIILPFYFIFLLCMLYRTILDFVTVAIDNVPHVINANYDDNVSSLVCEALPGCMVLVIVFINRKPWSSYGFRNDSAYKPLLSGSSGDESSAAAAQIIKDLFADPEVNYLETRLLRQAAVLGTGAAATAYRATYQGRTVAMKVYHLNISEMTKSQAQYVAKEVKMLAHISHPNIVQYFGITSTRNQQLAVVFEFTDRGSLHSVLAEMYKGLLWPRKLGMVLDIVRGMAFLHARSIVHGDLNSGNVLLTRVLQCKIANIALRALAESVVPLKVPMGESSEEEDNPSMEEEGKVGEEDKKREKKSKSIVSLAPEVLAGKTPTMESDVYGFGAILYEISSGHSPFSECSLPDSDMGKAIQEGKLAIKPSPACPKPIAEIIIRCTDPNPSRRPTFAQLEASLEEIYKSGASIQDEV